MDIMNSKKTLLSLINGGALLGASAGQQVTFKYASTIAKAIGAAADNGSLIFAVDATSGAGAIWAGAELVSSRVLDYDIAASATKDHGQKTVTLTYIDKTSGLTTKTFDLIDEAGLKAYFTGSKTIYLNDSSIYEVKVDGATILVDDTDGLKSGLKLVYVAGTAQTGASIQLQDAANTALNTIPVSNIIGNGVLDHSSYDKQKNELHLFFKTSQLDVYNEVIIPVGEILDINDIFIKNDSSIYLTATADTSVMNLGVLTADPSTASASNTGLADAWEVKKYVDSKSSDLSVTGQGDGTYINLEQDDDDNKKLNASAFVNDLVYAAGTDDANPATLTGSAGLVDGAQAGTAISNFVNQRLVQKVATLDASIDSTGTTFVEVGVAEVDGKVTNVKVTEHIGSLTGTTTAISGTAGLIDGAAAATAISTYVEGRLDASIQALDASLNATTNDISIYLTEVDGQVTNIGIEHSNATVTFTAKSGDTPASLTGSGSFVMGSDIEAIRDYVDAVAEAGFDGLDSQIVESDASSFITVTTGIVNGLLVDASSSVAVTYGDYDKTTQTDGIAKTGDTKAYVDSEIQSLDLANDVADASAHDTKNYIKTIISETDGIVKNEAVNVTYGDYSTHANGIATVEDTSAFVQAALTWQIIN